MAPIRMEVVAVSSSQPNWQMINGVKTYTSIVHTPITSSEECITVTPELGITSNKIAAHDAQIYAFFAHHYDYWCQELGVDRKDWDWCHWGENLTFRCHPELNEHDFNLGDVWRIGKTVKLQVCGSRVPCNKLSWRCGQKDKWLKELANTGFCGVYLRVLESGSIYPGDWATLVQKESRTVNCSTITKLAFDSSISTKHTLELLVNNPNLLNINKSLFKRKLSVMHDQQLLGRNAWKGWRRLRVKEIVTETRDIKSFYLIPVDDKQLAMYLPGQFLTFRLPDGHNTVRSWSISSWTSHDIPSYYRISIKRGAGRGSTWMHDQCAAGSTLEVRSPNGSFHLDWTPMWPGRQIYISAGIGITPLLAMLKAHVSHPAMSLAPAIWIHVARDSSSYAFRSEVSDCMESRDIKEAKLLQQNVFFTAPKQVDILGETYHHASRPTLELLSEMITDAYFIDPLKITPIEIEGKFSTVYICGPKSFEEDIKQHLRTLGVPDPMVHSESFTLESAVNTESGISKANIKFTRSGKTIIWKKPKDDVHKLGQTLLEVAEEAGLVPDYGCRAGTCASCEVGLKSGKVVGGMQPQGTVRICIARPASELVEIDL